MLHTHTRILQKTRHKRVVFVVGHIFDCPNTRCSEYLRAVDTRIVRHIASRTICGNPSTCTIGNRILFCVHRCLFVVVSHNTLVWRTCQEPVVPGACDASVVDNDTSNPQPVTCGTTADELCHLTKVLVPAHTTRTSHLYCGWCCCWYVCSYC